ncbi:MAG: TolC family protein [Planctomycetota bacterium]|nr:TolC family protein [Planctomycetota bacterium]MDA1114164.1 TolC family protein [Planctomycetota bacterium]
MLSLCFAPIFLATLCAQEPETPPVLQLSLEEVVLLASEQAPMLAQARLRALAAEGGVLEADGAFDPVLFADATYSFDESPANGFFSAFGTTKSKRFDANQGIRQALTTGGSFNLSFTESYNDASFLPAPQSDVSVALNFTQPLLRGAWNMTGTQAIRLAEFARDRDLAGIRQAGTDVVQAAVDAYWDLAFAYADRDVKQRSLSLAEELKALTEAKYRVGAVAEVEVVQTEADIASRTDALLTAHNTVHQSADRLRILLFGLEDGGQWDLELQPSSLPPVAESMELDWRDSFETAREYRADLRQLRIDIDQTDLDWKVAQRNTLPLLDLTGSGSYSAQETQVGDAFSSLTDRDLPGYNVGLLFEIPIGNAQYEGRENRTRQLNRLAVRNLRDRENEIANEVRDAVRNINFNAQRVTVTTRASAVARRQLEAEQRRLQEGASTNFQVLEFQTDLSVAETQEFQARMDYAKAATKLFTVQGLNWDGSRPDLADLDQYLPSQKSE